MVLLSFYFSSLVYVFTSLNIYSKVIHKTQRVLKSHKGKMGVLYMQHIYIILKTVCPPAINPMALWLLMHLCSWCTVTHCLYQWTRECSTVPQMCNHISCAQVHELPQSYHGDNRECTLFSWLHVLHVYIYIYIYIIHIYTYI